MFKLFISASLIMKEFFRFNFILVPFNSCRLILCAREFAAVVLLYGKMRAGFEGRALDSNDASNQESAVSVNHGTKELVEGHSSPASSSEGCPEVKDEYPRGIKLMFIGVALLLSVFLVGTFGKTSLSLVH